MSGVAVTGTNVRTADVLHILAVLFHDSGGKKTSASAAAHRRILDSADPMTVIMHASIRAEQ